MKNNSIMEKLTIKLSNGSVDQEFVLMTKCGRCNGVGRIMMNGGVDWKKCLDCNGSGYKYTDNGTKLCNIGLLMYVNGPDCPDDVVELQVRLDSIFKGGNWKLNWPSKLS